MNVSETGNDLKVKCTSHTHIVEKNEQIKVISIRQNDTTDSVYIVTDLRYYHLKKKRLKFLLRSLQTIQPSCQKHLW